MRIRKGAALGAVSLAAALVLAACGGSSDTATDTGTAGGDASAAAPITIHGSEPQNPLIPTNTNETGGGNIVDAMWTGLVAYDVETGAPSLAMAESIESTDFRNWTVKIKQGWKFHDGTEVKAKNFVDAWNWGAFGPNAQMNQYFFGPGALDVKGYDEVSAAEATVNAMTGLKVVDDYTFTVELAAPNSLFETIVGYSAFFPMPDSFFADPKAFEASPIGNGPFQFVSRTPSVNVLLKAFPDYPGDRKPQVQNVEFKMYQSLDAAYADIVANNLDVLDAMPTQALAGDVWKTDLAGRFVEKPLSSIFQSISFPMYDKKFDNVDLRKAISRALDRDAVISVAFGAGNRVPADGWVPPGNDGYQPAVCGDNCVYDAAAAKALLDKAGGFDGTLTIAYNADGGHKEWVDAACVSITNALDIKCQGKPFPEFGPFREEVSSKKMTGAFRTGWQADYPSIQNFLAPLYRTGASANDGDYSNPKFDELVDQAQQVPAAEANDLYNQAQLVLAEDMPVVPLWFSKFQGAWSDKINQPAFNWQGRVDLLSLSVK